MNNWIEAIKNKIINKMEVNRKAYEEADASYKDTGYNKYYNKMVKLDKEYEELEAFLLDGNEDGEKLLQLKNENEALRKVLAQIKTKVYYLSKELPRCSELISLEDILRQY